MARLTRKTQKVFAGDIPATNNIAQFGSLAGGTPLFSDDPDTIQALARFGQGWGGGVVGNQSPTLQDMNALFYLLSRQVAYVMQSGIPEYDVATTYYTGQFCQVDGVIYVSATDGNVGNTPSSGSAYWTSLTASIAPQMPGVAKAWCVFYGPTGTLISSHNVDSVTRTAAGTYTINITPGAITSEYAFSGSCGTVNGGSVSQGDNNLVCGTNLRTTTQCGVKCWDAGPQRAEDSDRVSVIFYALNA
jgi:hypothetical protein